MKATTTSLLTFALGSYPTDLERLDALSTSRSELWVKRDDRTCAIYGGNKVRKLEWLLGAARAASRTRLVTVGAAGSHQVVATALFGARAGFEVEAVLVPQPASAHARKNLEAALAQGLRAYPVGAWSLAPLAVAARWGRDAFLIPLGGSTPTGSLGFVEAARELAEQIAAGLAPEPDVIVVALGSGGTAAGLAVGLEQARMRTRVVGVAVSHPASVLAVATRALARRTAALVGGVDGARAASRIEVLGGYIGRGYGHPTREGQAATADALTRAYAKDGLDATSARGFELYPTYTAKAFAAALAHVRDGRSRVVLFWHTLSTAPLERLAPLAPGVALAPRLARLFR